jgi:hypothetical protein
MTKTSLARAAAILIGAAFSLVYAGLYQILVGGFVFYRYPYWPPPLAMAYVLGGILLQAWFCFRPGRPTGARLLAQFGAGIFYVASLAVLPGSIYMS